MEFSVVSRKPTVSEFNTLRRMVEWPEMDSELVKKALAHTLFAVVVEDKNKEVVAMGRIIGDGAIYLHIQDVIVNPDLQRSGLGKLVMDELMKFVERSGGKNTNVGLMCSKGREAFYRKFGFIDRPNEKFGAGMIQIKSR